MSLLESGPAKGGVAYLPKPFDAHSLLKAIATALDGK